MSSADAVPAVVLTKTGHPTDGFELSTIRKPDAGPGQLLVRVRATAINPIDWKQAAYNFLIHGDLPIVLGCDLAGEVEAVGDGVEGFKVGDAVLGFPGLGSPGRGSFATHAVIPAAIALRKPDSLSFEQASTFGVGALTAARCILGLGLLPEGGAGLPVLVWGGSTSVGQFAIQLLKFAGYTVIATASPRHFDALRELGADTLINYRDEDAVDQIRAAAGGELKHAIDTVGSASAAKAASALSGEGSAIITIAGAPEPAPEGVRAENVLVGNALVADEDIKNAAKLADFVREHVESGRLQPNPVRVVDGGLETGIVAALKLNQEGKLSREKAVVTVA